MNIGNQPWSISREERKLGVASDLIVNYATWLGYPADRVLGTVGKFRWGDWLRRCIHGFTAPFKYDILHYYFGRSSLYFDDYPKHKGWPFLDLRIARALGRTVFYTLQGCDARLATESDRRNRITMCRRGACRAYEYCIKGGDAVRAEFIRRILPMADRVFFVNPELGHYLPASSVFLPYANVDVEAIGVVSEPSNSRPLILHAPSDPLIKGTALIEDAIGRLKSRFDFDYVAVKGLPHAEAMELYKKADLVIDQVLSGWYGGFSVEVMAMGKPVAVYIRDEDLQFLPPGLHEDLPFFRVHPDSLADDLAAILDRRMEWSSIGRASRDFVMKWHHPGKIAKAMVTAYRHPESQFVLNPGNDTTEG